MVSNRVDVTRTNMKKHEKVRVCKSIQKEKNKHVI